MERRNEDFVSYILQKTAKNLKKRMLVNRNNFFMKLQVIFYLEQKSREKCIIVKFLAQLSMNVVTYYIKRETSNGTEIRVA